MSRKKIKLVAARKSLPDIKFGSLLITRFISNIMTQGKKNIAMKIMYNSLDEASSKLKIPQKEVVEKAVGNIKPRVEVKSRRVGGATYQIPQTVTEERGTELAIRWILIGARKRKGSPMFKRLASEFVDACRGEGSAVKMKDNVHKMAEANKAFAHYRW